MCNNLVIVTSSPYGSFLGVKPAIAQRLLVFCRFLVENLYAHINYFSVCLSACCVSNLYEFQGRLIILICKFLK
jgi:hypothetical protein